MTTPSLISCTEEKVAASVEGSGLFFTLFKKNRDPVSFQTGLEMERKSQYRKGQLWED